MKALLFMAAALMSSVSFAGKMVEREGYVQIAKYGTYKGSYVFASTLSDVRRGIEAPNALPEDVELLEICDWEGEFKTKDPVVVIHSLNIASIDKSKIAVSYYDNGEPLAGMCVDNIDLIGR